MLYKTYSFKEVEDMVREYRSKNASRKSIQNTLYRLKKKKLITKTRTGWSASKSTQATLENRSSFYESHTDTAQKNNSNKMIVMYDVPEELKNKRDQLRDSLKILNFKQKQKSVWIGPAPLPKEFVKYLGDLRILKYINFFEVKEEDIV